VVARHQVLIMPPSMRMSAPVTTAVRPCSPSSMTFSFSDGDFEENGSGRPDLCQPPADLVGLPVAEHSETVEIVDHYTRTESA
jgi:hypothetical protein